MCKINPHCTCFTYAVIVKHASILFELQRNMLMIQVQKERSFKNKIIRQASRCAECVSNKSRFTKKHFKFVITIIQHVVKQLKVQKKKKEEKKYLERRSKSTKDYKQLNNAIIKMCCKRQKKFKIIQERTRSKNIIIQSRY